MIEHGALSVRSAGSRLLARVDALVRDAGLIRVAVLVRAATKRAHVVQTDVTEETIVVQSTGEQTIAAYALLVERAFVVAGAYR